MRSKWSSQASTSSVGKPENDIERIWKSFHWSLIVPVDWDWEVSHVMSAWFVWFTWIIIVDIAWNICSMVVCIDVCSPNSGCMLVSLPSCCCILITLCGEGWCAEREGNYGRLFYLWLGGCFLAAVAMCRVAGGWSPVVSTNVKYTELFLPK